MMNTYEQAKADHAYLWSYAPAQDMSGGYVDQGDLYKLLEKPTKGTARDCFERQIRYWFQVGPDLPDKEDYWRTDFKVHDIADRYACSTALLKFI